MNDYTIYLNKTDEVVAFGSSRECAKALGMSRDSFYSMVSRVKKGKNRKYSIVIKNESGDPNEG